MSVEKTCILQVGYCTDNPSQPKTIRICGFLHPVESTTATAFVKEINYSVNDFAIGTIHTKTDSDLVKTLEKFDCVIVADSQTSEFISYYVKPSTQLVVLQNIFKSKYKSTILADVIALRTKYIQRFFTSENVQKWIHNRFTRQ